MSLVLALVATMAAVVAAVIALVDWLQRTRRVSPTPPLLDPPLDPQLMVDIQIVSQDLATSRGYPEAAPFIANHLYDVVRHIERGSRS